MNGRYDIKGEFVECCDCYTICPCWVSDIPDEDHCSGLYVWTFAKGSRIDGIDVSGMSIAAAAFHAVRSGGQAMLFIGTSAGELDNNGRAYRAILNAFTGTIDRQDPGQNEGQFQALNKLLGAIIGDKPAQIASKFEAGKFRVSVKVGKATIATAEGRDRVFEGNADPMHIDRAALTDELGIDSETPVTVQKMGKLTVHVAALPGGPLELVGRSGMRGKFHYIHRPKAETREALEEE
jgi:hypothetical protein